MINKFSIVQMMETAKKREEQANKKIKLLRSNTRNYVNGLSEELIYNMQKIGFRVDQIVAAHSQYNFLEVEEALSIMTRDVETGLFYHNFITKKEKDECQICDGRANEHYAKKEYPVDPNYKNKIRDFQNSIDTRRKNNSDNDEQDKFPKLYIKENKKESHVDTYDENLCPICFDNSISDQYFALECKHKICKSCVQNYFKINIIEGKVSNLKCLYGGCVSKYPHEVVKKFTDTNYWELYKKYVQNQEKLKILLNNPNIIHCPFPDCDELIELNNLQMGFLLPQHFVSCQEEHRFCLRCRGLEESHDNKTCENINEKLLNEIQEINKKDNYNYKQCPMCKIIIEKIEGCNHMKCSNCDHEFCWLCLQEYEDDHYAYYNFSGCPGLKYGKLIFLYLFFSKK